ncbi:MAG: hypothetical protein NT124_01495 [Candidatus Dependentiae bacterium]|nr:hypothetical protein [Candidatus Dependentiae bacterium]
MKNIRALGLLTLSLVASSAFADSNATKAGKAVAGVVLGGATHTARLFIFTNVNALIGDHKNNKLKLAAKVVAAAANFIGTESARIYVAKKDSTDLVNKTSLVTSVGASALTLTAHKMEWFNGKAGESKFSLDSAKHYLGRALRFGSRK